MRPGRKGPGYTEVHRVFATAAQASMRPGRKGPGYGADRTEEYAELLASMRPGRKGPGYFAMDLAPYPVDWLQ